MPGAQDPNAGNANVVSSSIVLPKHFFKLCHAVSI